MWAVDRKQVTNKIMVAKYWPTHVSQPRSEMLQGLNSLLERGHVDTTSLILSLVPRP